MLPPELKGPGKSIEWESPDEFLRLAISKFPHLDPDFILQICFEHPDRFVQKLPGFDVNLHSAVRVARSASWLYKNLRYDDNEEVDFWGSQFEKFLKGREGSPMFAHFMRNSTWPFPPVIINSLLGQDLGLTRAGAPFHLIEGTHRVSYLRRMMQLKLVAGDTCHAVIEIAKKAAT